MCISGLDSNHWSSVCNPRDRASGSQNTFLSFQSTSQQPCKGIHLDGILERWQLRLWGATKLSQGHKAVESLGQDWIQVSDSTHKVSMIFNRENPACRMKMHLINQWTMALINFLTRNLDFATWQITRIYPKEREIDYKVLRRRYENNERTILDFIPASWPSLPLSSELGIWTWKAGSQVPFCFLSFTQIWFTHPRIHPFKMQIHCLFIYSQKCAITPLGHFYHPKKGTPYVWELRFFHALSPEECFSKCDPRTTYTCLDERAFKNADSEAKPTYWARLLVKDWGL